MKKSLLIAILISLSTLGFSQMNQTDVESIFKGTELKSKTEGIFIYRKYLKQGEKWEYKFEKLDPETASVTVGEGGLIFKGLTYTIYLNYTNIKSINIWEKRIDINMVD